MSLKKRKPSMVFSWHKSFAILAPWRKGKLVCLDAWSHVACSRRLCVTPGFAAQVVISLAEVSLRVFSNL